MVFGENQHERASPIAIQLAGAGTGVRAAKAARDAAIAATTAASDAFTAMSSFVKSSGVGRLLLELCVLRDKLIIETDQRRNVLRICFAWSGSN